MTILSSCLSSYYAMYAQSLWQKPQLQETWTQLRKNWYACQILFSFVDNIYICTLILTFFVFNIGSNSSYPRNLSPSVLEHSDTALLTLPCHKANRSSWELLGSQFPNVRTPARFSEIVRSNSKVHMTFCIQYNLRFVLNIDVLLIK